MRNKKTIFAVAGICLLGIIAGTFAYFSTTDLFHNLINTDYYHIDTYDYFVAPDNWRPGDTTPKSLSITNNGNMDVAVRVSFKKEWVGKDNYYLGNYDNGEYATIVNFVDGYEDKWYQGETNTDHNFGNNYYYKVKLGVGETAPPLIESITFNPNFVADTVQTCETDETTHKKTCIASPDNYDGATFKLTIKIETVQYNMYKEAWNTSYKIYESQPYNLSDHIRGLVDTEQVANDDPDGTYRYIGKNPNNYILFNNELWRILGSYESGYARIIRDEPLGQFSFDTSESAVNNGKGINDWSQAKLQQELNNQYFDTRLTEDPLWYSGANLEKSNIGLFNRNYILTSVSRNRLAWNTWKYGCPNNNNGTEVLFDDDIFTPSYIYNKEKGYDNGKICTSDVPECTDTYARQTQWQKEVGLINISDYIYSTSGGATISREQCLNSKLSFFNDNSECGTNSWLNDIQAGDSNVTQFTLTPAASTEGANYVFGYNKSGKVIKTEVHNALYIHPVVELFHDAVYTLGDGSRENPYIIPD